MKRDTYTYCRVFGRGAVSTCIYDLGLSRLEFEQPTFRMQTQRFNPRALRHHRGLRALTLFLLVHLHMNSDLEIYSTSNLPQLPQKEFKQQNKTHTHTI